MCWMCKSEPIKMVAERDIPVQKILYDAGTEAYSIIYHYEWVIGTEYTTEIDAPYFTDGSRCFVICRGFHSCDRIRDNGYVFYNSSDEWIFSSTILNNVIYNAVIPAGSEYYVNESGEYVSNRLKIIGKANFY